MGDPASMAMMAAGGAFKAFSSIISGDRQAEAYKYQSSMAMYNAAIAKQNQKYSFDVGEQQAVKQGIAGQAQAGQIKAAQGASGVDVNFGSSKEVQTSQHLVSQMDLNTIREKAAKTAYDFSVQAVNYENQAKGFNKAAENSRTEGRLNAIGSLIGSAGSISSKWMQGQQVGLGNGKGLFTGPIWGD